MDYFEPDVTLRFSYTDAEGRMTARVVQVEHVDGDMLTGRDRKKNARRTFRIDRISNCWDEAAYEYVPDVLQHLREIHSKSPRASLDAIYNNHLEALQILLYVGKADGQLREVERKVITAFCKVFTGDVRITDELCKEFLDFVKIPGLHGFKVAVSKIANHGNAATMRRLSLACQTIVNTQQTVTAAEQEALNYMAKRFTKAVDR